MTGLFINLKIKDRAALGTIFRKGDRVTHCQTVQYARGNAHGGDIAGYEMIILFTHLRSGNMK